MLMVLTTTFAGCRSTTESGRTVRGTFIDGSAAGDAETLNWLIAADSASFGYAGLTMDSLATYDNNWQVVLRHLAKPVEISPDGLVYTMTIRNDLFWTGGKKVTADDYVYTLKNLMFSDWLNYTYKEDWQEEVAGKTVFVEPKVVNETTFTITRKTVDPEFLDSAIYGLTPYPKHIAQKYEGDVKAFTQAEEFNNLTYTGNLGPYKFKEWIRNDKFVTTRNPDFYLGKEDSSPFFEEMINKLLGTPAAVHAAMEAGDITYTGIDPDQMAKFQKMPNIKVYTIPTRGYQLINYNQRKNGWEGLKDKRVRQALSMCLDKQSVVNDIAFGFGEPAFSFIPRPSPWYSDEGVAKYGIGPLLNKDKARQTLFEAGYGTKKPDGSIQVTGKDGKPLKLTIATNTGVKDREQTAYLVKQELGTLGIEVELKLVPWATLLRKYLMNNTPGSNQEPRFNNGPDAVSEEKWDLMVMGLSTHPIAPSGTSVFFASDGGLNFWGSSTPGVDALFKKARTKDALDPAARKQIYGEISRLIADDQPANFLFFPAANPAFQSNVRGIEPGMRIGWNSHLWYFAER
jgi:peptide/nickel transport system substrate-binding protein